MNDVHFSSKSVEWETPQDFFDKLNAEFDFTLDACASDENYKCERYFTVRDNGLAQSFTGERVWINPPYGTHIKRWIEKAATTPSEVTVMLIPARTDTKAWHRHIFGNAEIRFIEGRLKFNGHQRDAPFPCAVVIFRPKGIHMTLKQLAENYLGPPPEHSDMVREEDNEELQSSYRKEVETLVGFVEYVEKEGRGLAS
jgi:phage N-6-adenine-methyltransferase